MYSHLSRGWPDLEYNLQAYDPHLSRFENHHIDRDTTALLFG